MMENFAEFRKKVVKPQINYTSPWYARKVIRKFSPYITWYLVKYTPISANQVTLMQFVVSLVGLAFLCSASLLIAFCGVVLLHLGYIFDVVDGEVARYREKTSLSGMFLDFVNHATIMPMTFGCLSFHYFFVTSLLLYFYLGLGIILLNINPLRKARQTTINYLIAKRKAPSYDIKNYAVNKNGGNNRQHKTFEDGKSGSKSPLKKIERVLHDIFDYPNDIIIVAVIIVLEIIIGNAFVGKLFILAYFSYASMMFIATLWWQVNHNIVEKSFMAHVHECQELVRANPGLFGDEEKEC